VLPHVALRCTAQCSRATGTCAELPPLSLAKLAKDADKRSDEPRAAKAELGVLSELMADRGAHHTSPLGIVHFHMQQFLLDERKHRQ
jgi:hypothetical protein